MVCGSSISNSATQFAQEGAAGGFAAGEMKYLQQFDRLGDCGFGALGGGKILLDQEIEPARQIFFRCDGEANPKASHASVTRGLHIARLRFMVVLN